MAKFVEGVGPGSSYMEAFASPKRKELLEKWSKNIDGVNKGLGVSLTDEKAFKLSILLENLEDRMRELSESTQAADVGPFKKVALPMLTAIYPTLLAEDLVSVQAMEQKIAQIFAMKVVYGSTKGTITAGTEMFSPYQVAPQAYNAVNYSSEYVESEPFGEGDGTEDEFEGNLAYTPVRRGSVKLVVGTDEVNDNGNGVIAKTGFVAGTIDYDSGAVVLTFTAAPSDGDAIEFTYQYDLEYAPSTIPQADVKLVEEIVRARARKLRTLYSWDAAYDLKKAHGVEMDTALLEAVTSEIKHEIDGEIMLDLYNQAGLTSTWNRYYDAATYEFSEREFRTNFLNEIISASNQIFNTTRRADGNFIVVGSDAANILESIGDPRFKHSGEFTTGPHFCGTLDNRWKVYKNPFYASTSYVVGYKGNSWMEAGYVYAPYMPIATTTMLMLDDFVARRGYATSYAKKMINSNFYVQGTMTNTKPA